MLLSDIEIRMSKNANLMMHTSSYLKNDKICDNYVCQKFGVAVASIKLSMASIYKKDAKGINDKMLRC